MRRLLLGALGAAAFAGSIASFAKAEAAPLASPSSSLQTGKLSASLGIMEDKQPLPRAQDLSAEELSTIKLFQENTPAVVNVSNIVAARLRFSTDVLKLPQGQGSGFIWDKEGHIVTNFHVVRGAAELRVTLLDQSVYKARIVGADPAKDVAVLQLVEAPKSVLQNLKPVQLGNSSELFVGQRVLAIGSKYPDIIL